MAESASPSMSVSLPNNVDEPEEVSDTVPASITFSKSITVTGGSLTGIMLIVTVTGLLNAVPSLMRYVKVSVVVSEPSCT